jgi:uncharacterized RDD family membrane protein YckC
MPSHDPTKVVGRRVAAFLIDALIGLAIDAGAFFALATKHDHDVPFGKGGIHFKLTSGGNTWEVHGGKGGVYLAITLGLGLLLHVVLVGLRGWSPGKLLLGIRVVREDGRAPGIGRALLRGLLWIVDDFPYFIPFVTGFVCVLTTKRHRRVGDMVAGTFVIGKQHFGQPVPPEAALAPPVTSPGPPPPPGGLPQSPPPPGAIR